MALSLSIPDTTPQLKSTTLKIVCAWCGADMGTVDGKGITGTSHAICHACFEHMAPSPLTLKEKHDD